MKTKLLTAYEPESSATIRVTPEDIAVLVSQIPESDWDKFFSTLNTQSIYMMQPRREKFATCLAGSADHYKQ